MNIVLTGSSSGVGLELSNRLSSYNVLKLTRSKLDLSDVNAVRSYNVGHIDMLINCAATGIGGKIDLINHKDIDIVTILNTNLISPILLSKKALLINSKCKIVNITSTNNNRYYSNDLVYSLSKKSLGDFGDMLRVEYHDVNLLEIRLGLTKTNFNNNRYNNNRERFVDIYQYPHLSVEEAVDKIIPTLFDPTIKFIEVSP